jgi:hypothetical protein
MQIVGLDSCDIASMRAQNQPDIVVIDKNLTASAKRLLNKKRNTTDIKDYKKLNSKVFDANTPSMFDEVSEESS